jgi:hypothetical protein
MNQIARELKTASKRVLKWIFANSRYTVCCGAF